MSIVAKIGIFIAVIVASNYLISLIFKFISKKTKAVHLHFSKIQKSYEKVLKPFDFRTFSGPSDWIRTSGLLNPIQEKSA